MKKLVTIFFLSLFVLPVLAEEQEVTQEIKSSKGFATVNLDSQITPDGKIKKQKITNEIEWHNLFKRRSSHSEPKELEVCISLQKFSNHSIHYLG